MARWRLVIKEKSGEVLRPEYVGPATQKEIEDFFGCHEPDVESFSIEQINDKEDEGRK